MSDATYIACPRCGEPYAMTPMQKRLFHGRTLACQRCAKPFTVTEQTPDPVPAPAVRPWAEFPEPLPSTGGAAAPPIRDANANGDADATAPAPPVATRPPPARRPGAGMTPGRMALLLLVVLVALGSLVYVMMQPAIRRARETSDRAACIGNLQQIGTALQMYASDWNGQFPDSLDPLILNGTLSVDSLVCPSSGDTVAPGSTFPEQLANLANGKHHSYVYIGKGLSALSARQPVAYEPLHHHQDAGVHVLYSDGTVQFLPASVAVTALPQLAGGATATTTTSPATAAQPTPAGQ